MAAFTHLVPMHKGRFPARTPLFVCAGMFGNVLNLRQLAIRIGATRPFYGLQARGLFGDVAPHETFEEMAAANIAEMRTVQPSGPYLLGGFSGGGLVALEMATQLEAAGDRVALLAFLDTPFPETPTLTAADRALIRLEDLRTEGVSFASNWLSQKIAFREAQRAKREERETQQAGRLNNARIEAAFYRALERFEPKRYDGPVLLLRPQLNSIYTLRDGRKLNANRELVRADNGWSPSIANLRTVEVIGDHDGMVLEPAVRVLARHLSEALDGAEAGSAQLQFIAAE
ncbi:MAG: thioesterase domain-containing protein [Pseudomonadota bacterium]